MVNTLVVEDTVPEYNMKTYKLYCQTQNSVNSAIVHVDLQPIWSK